MRVFIGLTEVAGYYRGLKRGFDELGVKASYVDLSEHRFAYQGESPGLLVRAIKNLRKRPGAVPRMLNRVLRGLLFGWALFSHDLFIFGFNSSFIEGQRDLPILKRFNKTIIFQFHGSDSRPPYLDGSVMAADRGFSIEQVIAMTAKKKQTLARIDRYADLIVDIPPQAHLHERELVLWLRVGIPCRPPEAPERLPEAAQPIPGQPIRILHSPSHPESKGSLEIAQAVAELQGRGLPLELVQLSGRPHAEVLAELARADFVIDQLYADYAMPGFATEAAWFGKPTLIGGYAGELWDALLPIEARPPTHYCRPEQLLAGIEQLATDRAYRLELGARARRFVESVWHPKQVAQNYLRLAAKEVPESWRYDPRQLRYWQGCGAPEEKIRGWIRAVLERGGPAALQLEDKPELLQRLVEETRGKVG